MAERVGASPAGGLTNGLSFDVPVLRRAFRGWRPPAAHVDLRRMIERLRLPATPVQVQERGDVRYDVTKLLLAL